MPSITNRKLTISDRITLTKIHHPLTAVVVDGHRDGSLVSGLDSSWKVESDKHDSLTVIVDGRVVRPTVSGISFIRKTESENDVSLPVLVVGRGCCSTPSPPSDVVDGSLIGTAEFASIHRRLSSVVELIKLSHVSNDY